MSVAPIPPDRLERIVPKHGPTESLLASAAAFAELGQEFSANLCIDMARDASALGSMGDALYSFWAAEQAVRVADLQRRAA